MAVFKFCVRNSSFCLALFPVSIFCKQWSLMIPGLQWVCLCPCTSSAVVPLPDTALVRPYLACVPLPIHNTSSGMKSWESCGVSCKGSVTPAHHFLCCQLGNHSWWWQCDTQVCWQAGTWSTVQAMWGFPLSVVQEGHHFLPLCKLWKDICCLFLVFTFLKLAWNWSLNLWGDWHFHWSAFFRERVKNLVLHRFKSLVTVVLKHWNPA